MATVQVRYIVEDVDAAIAFYCGHLGFREVMHPAPSVAMLSRGDLRLALNKPGGRGGGGRALPGRGLPTPGGWNRFTLEVSDLAAEVSAPSRCRRALPRRHRRGHGREADPRRRPLGESRRAVRAHPQRRAS